MAWLMDDAIPLPGGYRIGLDGLLGLFPGLGDGAGLITNVVIMLRAGSQRAGWAVMARMVGNVMLEALVGVIPGLGDLFDFYFKSNRRNVALLEAYTAEAEETRETSAWLLIGWLVALIVVFAVLFVAMVWTLGRALALLGGLFSGWFG
ncbi:MAG: DUF4112 domain-containing protein [Pseudomonadota bacterium]